MKIIKKQKKITKSFCVDPKIYNLLAEFCVKEEISVSQMMEFLIIDFFDIEKDAIK